MSLEVWKQTLEHDRKTQENENPLSIYTPENIGENKGIDKHQIYRTIFCCKYTVMKE
jgi:hypothetical protein